MKAGATIGIISTQAQHVPGMNIVLAVLFLAACIAAVWVNLPKGWRAAIMGWLG